jgi:hypothetical protein
MEIMFDESGNPEGLKDFASKLSENENVRGLLILACDANEFCPDNIDSILKGIKVPIFGGIFPEIIYEGNKYSNGTIIAGLFDNPNVQIIPDLSNTDIIYDDILDEKFPDETVDRTLFVFVDGFSKRISALIESMFNVFGLECNYIGGGAGSLSFVQKPCLFTNDGLIQDSAVLAFLNVNSGIGVRHGWQKISGPFDVTESDKNIIKTINWKPAFEVYKEVVEEHSGSKSTKDNFFDIAKKYPFG